MTLEEIGAAALLGGGGSIGGSIAIMKRRRRRAEEAHRELHDRATAVVEAHWPRESEHRKRIEHANLMRRGVR